MTTEDEHHWDDMDEAADGDAASASAPSPADKKLTPRQLQFARLIGTGTTQRDAYRQIYGKSNDGNAYRAASGPMSPPPLLATSATPKPPASSSAMKCCSPSPRSSAPPPANSTKVTRSSRKSPSPAESLSHKRTLIAGRHPDMGSALFLRLARHSSRTVHGAAIAVRITMYGMNKHQSEGPPVCGPDSW